MIDPLNPAGYVIARRLKSGEPWSFPNHAPVPADKAFVYVLTANGLLKRAQTRHFAASVTIARWARPLPNLARIPTDPYVVFHPGRIPASLLDACLAHARRVGNTEVLYQFYISGRRVHVHRPRQLGSAGSIRYAADDLDPADVVLDLHSHHNMTAQFSLTDNRDETGLRVYGVIGRLGGRVPHINLRVGIYGDFGSVPATSVFHGVIDAQDLYHNGRRP